MRGDWLSSFFFSGVDIKKESFLGGDVEVDGGHGGGV